MFDVDPHEVYSPPLDEALCRSPLPDLRRKDSQSDADGRGAAVHVYGPYDKFDFAVSHVTAALIRRVVERHTRSRSGATVGRP